MSFVLLGLVILTGFHPPRGFLAGAGAVEVGGWPGRPAVLASEGIRPAPSPVGAERVLPDLFHTSIQMFMALLGVLACLGAAVVLVRRYMDKSGLAGRGGCVRVLATGYIGHRKGIYIVDVAGRVIVLGVTPTGISFLTSIDDRESVERLVRVRENPGGVPLIGRYIERLCRRGGLGDGASQASGVIRDQVERLQK